MSYQKNYPNGWQSGEAGGTPITPAALDNIENGIANALPKDGTDPMTADLPMGGHRVTGLGEPVADGDAVPRGYANGHFAPAGYGLGGNPSENIINSTAALNAFYANGYFVFTGGTNDPIQSSGPAINYGYGHMDVYTDGRAKQTIHPTSPNDAQGSTLVRYMKSGTWDKWGWENPPMIPGVEYRTTERWNGKPVYAQLVNLGTLPNATSGAVPLPITGAEKFIEYNLVETSTSNPNYQNLNTTDIELVFGFNNPGSTNGSSWVDIHAKANHSAYTGELSMKYTKV